MAESSSPRWWSLRIAAIPVSVVALCAGAQGWLYWLRLGASGWLGPRLADGLPLDELPSHAAVPLVTYVAVFGLAALGLGGVARWAELDRLSAAFVLTLAVGAWMVAVDSASLYVVRQTPGGTAVHAAERLPAVWLAALLAGAAGALVGRPPATSRRWNSLLGWAVGAAGLADIASAMSPRIADRIFGLGTVAPDLVASTAHVAIVPVGVVLVLCARGLGRGSRRAWQLAVALVGASCLLHVLKGLDYKEVLAAGVVALGLIARRHDFDAPGDPATRRPAAVRLAGFAAFAYAYAVCALFVNRTAADLPFRTGPALREAALALVGARPHEAARLAHGFPTWLPSSTVSILAVGAGWGVATWLAPWRHQARGEAARRDTARRIVRAWGSDTLSPFALRADKSVFVHPEDAAEPAMLAYRVVGGVALVSGDPIGPGALQPAALDAFIGYARHHGWRVAVLGAGEDHLGLYRERGFRCLYHGDEAVLDVDQFALDGPPMRVVRQAVGRVRRHHYRSETLFASDLDLGLRAELRAVETAWLGARPRKGFVMELDDLFRLDDDDALFVIGRDESGVVAGFLHLCVCWPSRSLSLSSMPRRRDTPNGFNAWLVTEAVGWAKAHGFEEISLNFSPFAGLLGGETDLPLTKRIERDALLRVKAALALQLDNLYVFNKRFCPRWRPRYFVYERRGDLPRAAIAAMAAERYLPLPARFAQEAAETSDDPGEVVRA